MRAFPNLQAVCISNNLPEESGRLGLNAGTIEKMIETLFCNFFVDNTDSKMQVLEFKVQRPETRWDYRALEKVYVKVNRLSGSTVPKLNEGGYESFAERKVVSC